MFVSSHIFKMPMLGTIAYAMGHFAVPFKNTADPNCMELVSRPETQKGDTERGGRFTVAAVATGVGKLGAVSTVSWEQRVQPQQYNVRVQQALRTKK